jgi:hypothetical protein
MRATFLTAGLLIGLSPLSMAAQIYKWIDAQALPISMGNHLQASQPLLS